MGNPTKNETKEFIMEKTQVVWNKGDWIEERHQSLSFENDTLVVRHKATQEFYHNEKRFDTRPLEDTFSVELKDLDPTRVELISNGIIILHAKNDENLVKINDQNWESEKRLIGKPKIYYSPSTKYWSYLEIETHNPSLNSPKCAKAFEHLIQLCGGKGELF